MNALAQTNFQLPNQTAFYRGKVRDVYTVGDILIMVARTAFRLLTTFWQNLFPIKGKF